MAGRSVDVSLVVKAVDQSKSALDTVAKSLASITAAQKAVASGSGDVGKALDELLKDVGGVGDAYKGIVAGIKSAEEAFKRQSDALASTNASIDARKAKIQELKAVEASYRAQLSKGFVGPRQAELADLTPAQGRKSLSQVKSELTKQTTGLGVDERAQSLLLEKIREARTATVELAAAQREVAPAVKATADAYDRINDIAQKSILPIKAAAAARQQEVDAARKLRDIVQGTVDKTPVPGATVRTVRAATNGGSGSPRVALDTGAREAADAMRREQAIVKELTGYVNEMRRSFDAAGYAEKVYTDGKAKLDAALKRNILNTKEHTQALADLKKRSQALGDNSEIKLFGLQPYQTQNLMMQFNDVATQLASGTSLTQTLAQQGGQILQLFPRVGNAIVGAFTVATAATAAFVAGVAIVVAKSFDLEAAYRSFGSAITASANVTGQNTKGLYDAATALDRYGLSAEEAAKTTKALFREGLNAEQIKAFGTTAKDMADVLGIEVNAALSLLTDAYTGNYDALQKLMDATGSFSPEQRKQINDMYEQGKAAEAVAKAMDIVSAKVGAAAKEARSTWTEAFRNLGNSWDTLTKQLANTWWVKAFVNTINAAADVLNILAGASNNARAAEQQRQAVMGNIPSTSPGGMGDPLAVPQAPGAQQGTADQQNNAEKARKAEKEAAAAATKITSEAAIRTRLAAIEDQYRRDLGTSVTKQVADELVGSRIARERVKLEEELTNYKKQQAAATKAAADAAERERREKEKLVNTYQYQAADMLRKSEKFIDRAAPDNTWRNGKLVNSAFRVGYGSDTVTRADGTTARVTSSTTVSKADAERDLARRIEDVAKSIKGAIGSERFGNFSAKQQAALISIVYNYGKLPDRIVDALKKGTIKDIAAAIRTLKGDNPRPNGVGQNAGRREREAATFDVPNLAIDQSAEEIAKKAEVTRAELDNDLKDRLAKEDESLDNQRALVGLQGEALVRKRTELELIQRINEETRKLRDSLNDPDAELDPAALAKIRENSAEKQALELPVAAESDLQVRVNELLALRDTIQQQIRSELERGNAGTAQNLETQLAGTNNLLLSASEQLLQYQIANAEALGLSAEAIETLRLRQDALTESTRQWVTVLGLGGEKIANVFTGAASNALSGFAQAIANGKNAFESLADAFRSFAANFLLQIAQMIQQQIIFNLVSRVLSAVGGGLGGGGAGIVGNGSNMLGGISNLSVPGFHTGGIVGGSATFFRSVSPAMFANAARYHSGGIAGLQPGEVPAILQREEEVLTRDDPRHIMNSGGGSNVKIVNTFDEADFFSKGANTNVGEKAILNMVRANPRAFKSAMGG